MKTIGGIKDYIKGNRIGSREAELENSSGWTAVRKVHKSKRSYSRKAKHKKSGNNPDFFFYTIDPPDGTGVKSFSASAEKHSTGRRREGMVLAPSTHLI